MHLHGRCPWEDIGEQYVQEYAKAINVGAGICLLPCELLWRNVGQGATDRLGLLPQLIFRDGNPEVG